MRIPAALRPRLLHEDDGLLVVLDDDRGARWLSLGGGAIGVGLLAGAMATAGPGRWVLITLVPLLGMVMAALATRYGRRPVPVHLGPEGIAVAARYVAYRNLRGAQVVPDGLELLHQAGSLVVPASGEDAEVVKALAEWLNERASGD